MNRFLRRAPLALACFTVFGAATAATVDPQLNANGGAADALIVFASSTPSLAPLAADADYKLRRRALVDALRAEADHSQRDVRAWLDAHGVAYRSFWISNVIEARLSQAQLVELSRRSDITHIKSNAPIRLALPAVQAVRAPSDIDAIPYGVTKIEAPEVWAAGYNGQGVVIAGQDTGYQWDHPALQAHYRGWDGSTADHAYNWHDSIHDSSGNPCGNDSPEPCDDNGHGTHTAGTFAGDDGGTHQIGVAPGAKWIGCRNMNRGDGTPATYIECMQWVLAPTDANNENPNPDLAPDVMSNSWGCPPSEGCTTGEELGEAVANVVAGGIFFAASATNAGPSCGSIFTSPATYDASFVVGATDSQDRMADFSSRGPVSGVERIRPDISAPGVGVNSSWPPAGYINLDGTSMAAPHVAGAAALVMSVNPELKGFPDQVAEILRETAVTEGITDPSNDGCGGLTMEDWPNYQAGYGRLDAYLAALIAQSRVGGMFHDGFDGLSGPPN